MGIKEDLNSLRRRLIAFASRFDERARSGLKREGFKSAFAPFRRLSEGVTREGLEHLVRRETSETLRFYTREIDFEELRRKPWYRRYPEIAWKSFVAMASRLSPPRRIAFAAAIAAFLIGLLQLSILWFSASVAILSLLLLMELRDKLDLKGDLEIAREIQLGLVPSQPYSRNGFDIHSYMRPANTVGGDYHDILTLGERQVGIVVGDVAGKGMPAALLMALVQGSLRTLITAGLRGAALITQLNRYLSDNIPENSFVTLFYGEIDLESGSLHFINAGHNPPFFASASGRMERLRSTSLVLGFSGTAEFTGGIIQLDPGDSLMLFSDGISECFNESGEEYGDKRLADFFDRNRTTDPEQFLGKLIDEVLGFSAGVRPVDDMTVMLVRRRPF